MMVTCCQKITLRERAILLVLGWVVTQHHYPQTALAPAAVFRLRKDWDPLGYSRLF